MRNEGVIDSKFRQRRAGNESTNQQLTINGGYQIPAPSVVSEFTKIDALPGAHIKLSMRDGYGKFTTGKYRFDVGRHIITALHRMLIPGFVFRNQFVKYRFKIIKDRGVGIFVNANAG
jgi:hypothetical protein